MRSTRAFSRRAFVTAVGASAAHAFASRIVGAQESARARRPWRAVQNLLDDWVDGRQIAGCAAALSIAGEPLMYLGSGTLALDSQAPFDEMSLCRIASLTKVITGTAVMTPVERGTLRLEQPVVDVLPEWRDLSVAVDRSKNLEARPATKRMTIRHLLTHTSGLGDWAPSAGSDPLTLAYRERGITPTKPANHGTTSLSAHKQFSDPVLLPPGYSVRAA